MKILYYTVHKMLFLKKMPLYFFHFFLLYFDLKIYFVYILISKFKKNEFERGEKCWKTAEKIESGCFFYNYLIT